MQTRPFQNKEQISLLGFGTMRLPRTAKDRQDIDEETGRKMVNYAIANGVNYFDTAYRYHDGRAEAFLGEALEKYPRDSYYLATKMPFWLAEGPADLDRIFEEQLKNCRTDYFDFYLIHNVNEAVWETAEKYKVYDFLKAKQRAGKIRHIGFSFHDSPKLLRKVISAYAWDFAQIQLNYLDWKMQDAKQQYDILTEKKIPVIVMEPVRGGSLAVLSPKATDILKAAAPEKSTASWAIRYAASFPNVLTVLSGMSDPAQLKDNIETLSDFKPLSEEEYKAIEKAADAYRTSMEIPCTYCRYCMECPSGVHIPKVFAIYNRQRTHEAVGRTYFDAEYRLLGEERQAHRCTRCGVCLSKCPQGIRIPDELEKAAKFAAER